jgi:hypothetical protein
VSTLIRVHGVIRGKRARHSEQRLRESAHAMVHVGIGGPSQAQPAGTILRRVQRTLGEVACKLRVAGARDARRSLAKDDQVVVSK